MKERSLELIDRLKQLNKEVDKKIAHAEHQPRSAKKYEVTETKLMNELQCLDKTQKILEKELEFLQSKVNADTSFAKVVEIEQNYSRGVERNEAISKEIRALQNAVHKNELRFQQLLAQGTSSPQREEERLLKHIQKEYAREKEILRRRQREIDALGPRDAKEVELREKIAELSGELEALKEEAKLQAPSVKSAESDTITLSKGQLVALYEQLQVLHESEIKSHKKESTELLEEIERLRRKFKELDHVILTVSDSGGRQRR